MKQIFCLSILISSFCFDCFAQSGNEQCQQIEIKAPKSALRIQPINVSANYKENNQPINSLIRWKVIRGDQVSEKIDKETIIIEPTIKDEGNEIIVLAEIDGLKCRSFALTKVFVENLSVQPTTIERYGKISREAEKVRLDNLYFNFQEFDKEAKDAEKTRLFAFLNYDKNTPYHSIKNRLQNILNYLSKVRGMKKDRIVFIIRETGEEETQYQILPSSFADGKWDYGGCLIVKGEDYEKLANLFQPTATKK